MTALRLPAFSGCLIDLGSVLLDERVGNEWTPRLESPLDFYSALFLPSDHLGVTRHEVFRDNVLFWLLEEPTSP